MSILILKAKERETLDFYNFGDRNWGWDPIMDKAGTAGPPQNQ